MRGDQAIYKVLKSTSAVTSLAGVYLFIAPENITTNYIVINQRQNNPFNSKTSSSRVDVTDVEVQIVSDSIDGLLSIEAQVRAALDYYEGTITLSSGSIDVDRCWFNGSTSDYEREPNKIYYILDCDYTIRIRRTPDYIK